MSLTFTNLYNVNLDILHEARGKALQERHEAVWVKVERQHNQEEKWKCAWERR